METLSYVQLMERYLTLVTLVEEAYYEGWSNALHVDQWTEDEHWQGSNTKQKLEGIVKCVS